MSLQVMRHISEGLVAFMLERHDHAKPILRSVARELLSSCVLRCLMFFFNPYTANKVCAHLTSHFLLDSGSPDLCDAHSLTQIAGAML